MFIRPVVRISPTRSPDFEIRYRWTPERARNLLALAPAHRLVTNYKPGFFHWRYGLNPNVNYYLAAEQDSGSAFIFRLKPFRFGTELRIVNIAMNKPSFGHNERALLSEIIRSSGARLVTVAGVPVPSGFIPVKAGPVVTVRSVALDKPLSFGLWKPSLGDMEVF